MSQTTVKEARGTIEEVWAQEGYGHIVTGGRARLRFEREDVSGDGFDDLVVGAEVAFRRDEAGDEPRATDIRVLRAGPELLP